MCIPTFARAAAQTTVLWGASISVMLLVATWQPLESVIKLKFLLHDMPGKSVDAHTRPHTHKQRSQQLAPAALKLQCVCAYGSIRVRASYPYPGLLLTPTMSMCVCTCVFAYISGARFVQTKTRCQHSCHRRWLQAAGQGIVVEGLRGGNVYQPFEVAFAFC